ncbi:hypothetical protein [Xanthobacter autotrophicus]|uniref:hypothetical protein n=1 Tax=Xanthobacter autotrophicus TaxID=280 RepID=UPI0024A75803|nr:hypothetical protein [Xanthobacter autotrophicus]MDI4655519.1 hypothetical protein [Xanthobacter autotrophicus]
MSALQLQHDRTDWRPAFGTGLVAGQEPTGSSMGLRQTSFASSRPVIAKAIGMGDFIANALLFTLIHQGTSAPLVAWPSEHIQTVSRSAVALTEAQRFGEELRRVSGLTNEEIAPLLGVSRRSFQAWLAGEAISARKEGRMRATVEAIRAIATPDPFETRARLLNRDSFSVRPYDLLVEGRYEAAIILATGRRVGVVRSIPAEAETLAEQIDRSQESLAAGGGTLNRRLSKPIRR